MQNILNWLGIHMSTSLFLGIFLASFLGTCLANRLQR